MGSDASSTPQEHRSQEVASRQIGRITGRWYLTDASVETALYEVTDMAWDESFFLFVCLFACVF